jgi:hypothetical protein
MTNEVYVRRIDEHYADGMSPHFRKIRDIRNIEYSAKSRKILRQDGEIDLILRGNTLDVFNVGYKDGRKTVRYHIQKTIPSTHNPLEIMEKVKGDICRRIAELEIRDYENKIDAETQRVISSVNREDPGHSLEYFLKTTQMMFDEYGILKDVEYGVAS